MAFLFERILAHPGHPCGRHRVGSGSGRFHLATVSEPTDLRQTSAVVVRPFSADQERAARDHLAPVQDPDGFLVPHHPFLINPQLATVEADAFK
jgi:hypothetical protein